MTRVTLRSILESATYLLKSSYNSGTSEVLPTGVDVLCSIGRFRLGEEMPLLSDLSPIKSTKDFELWLARSRSSGQSPEQQDGLASLNLANT